MNSPLDDLYWRDEILQILYWFRGEGLGEAVTPQELQVFLDVDETDIQTHLDRLVGEGYVLRLETLPPHYQLTELGVKEGGRRFADEFSGLTGQAHGECNNPNCACKTLGPAACESHH
jgi:hypothetical protein